jgi:FixJ family two-component response regulator
MYMPGSSGLDLLKKLSARNYPAPVLMFSGRGDIPNAVEAIRNGAFDFVEKRLDTTIGDRVLAAVAAWAREQQNGARSQSALLDFPGRDQLTRRERDVLVQITTAASNREAAANLGISRRTVEIHRRHIMQKLGAKNTVDLVRMVINKARSA